MTRLTVEALICSEDGLGYCCQYAFFCMYQRTSQIADRLGVTPRAVRYHKMSFAQGDMTCQERKRCLKATLQALGKIPRLD